MSRIYYKTVGATDLRRLEPPSAKLPASRNDTPNSLRTRLPPQHFALEQRCSSPPDCKPEHCHGSVRTRALSRKPDNHCAFPFSIYVIWCSRGQTSKVVR